MSFIQISGPKFMIHESAAKGLIENCQYIIKNGGNIGGLDQLGWSSIMYAARNGHEHVVKILHENGACIKMPNKYGYTPLSLAVASGNENTFNYILEAMFNYSKENLKEDITSFGLACFLGRTTFVKLLLSLNIFDLNDPVLFGMTPIVLATLNGKIETAKVLLSAGANKFVNNLHSQSCYDIAVYRRDSKMQALLSENKFINSPMLPLTPLNNRMIFSPSINKSSPKNIKCKIFYNTAMNNNCNEIENFPSDNRPSLDERQLNEKDQQHSYCNCHYLNSLLSPRILNGDKEQLIRKKGIFSMKEDVNHAQKYSSIKKDKWLPWVKRKLNKRYIKCIENEAKIQIQNSNNTNNDENHRLRENLKITELLTILRLEEYISTFIMQEIDADTITSLTEEDLINIGVSENKLDKVLQKISKLNMVNKKLLDG